MAATTAYVIRALPGLPQLGGDGLLVASPRARMLDAMTAAVAEHGYAATSIAEVINHAHASRRTFYEQFTDKEDCYLAAYQLATDYITGRLAEAVDGSPPELSDASHGSTRPTCASSPPTHSPLARSSLKSAPPARPANDTAAPSTTSSPN